ncbi:MAG: hypothetical protein ABEJ58_08065 [Halodesulfurarchaeum sp.]
MTLRVLLALLVATALLASSIPAMDAAYRTRTDHVLGSNVDRIRETIGQIRRRSDPVPIGVPGSRHRVHVDVPDRGPNALLRIGHVPGLDRPVDDAESDVIGVRVGSEDTTVTIVDSDIRVVRNGEVRSEDAGLLIREDVTLTMTYATVNGNSTILLTRGFTSPNPTSIDHVRISP